MLSARRVLFLASLGGAFEMYYFVIYIYLTPFLSELFFPNDNAFISLLSIFAVFAIGYLIRPFGGMLFGHFGDRLGRKKTFVTSILLMSIPVILIGLLPGYQTIGLAAPLLLVVLRILQGIAVGGEIPGAMTFTSECIGMHKRGLASGAIYCGLNCGIAFAALILGVFKLFFDHHQMMEFGWRILFILGGLLGLIAGYLRNKTSESDLFLSLQKKNLLQRFRLKALIHKNLMKLLIGLLITAMGSAIIVIGFAYLKEYLIVETRFNGDFATWLVGIGMLASSFLQIAFGHLSDCYNRLRLLAFGALLSLVLLIPIFHLFALNLPLMSILAMALLSLTAAMIIGIYPGVLISLFPTEVRYSGYATCYNIAFAIVGGLGPLIVTYLIHQTHNLLIPPYYMGVALILGLIGLGSLASKHKKSSI